MALYDYPSSIEAGVQVGGTDQCFKRVSQDRVLIAAVGADLAFAKKNMWPQVETAGNVGKCHGRDDRGTFFGELTFGFVLKGLVEVVGDQHTKDRVAKELQPFVGGQIIVLK